MTHKDDLPFTVGQEVEAKFNESGYRGAWFRCRIREITAAEPKLLVHYVDFLDEEDSWARVRMADPAVKGIKRKKLSIWMVRPVPPVVHESNVDEYQEDVRMGRKCSSFVYIYNDIYMVGDMVDWWKDDCFWAAQIVGINTKTNVAKLKFPLPPVGEGDGKIEKVPFKDLRPSFSWNPKHQWRQLRPEKEEASTTIKKCKSNKLHIQRVYLSGDSITPGVMNPCGPISFGNTSSVCKSELDDSAVNSRDTPREDRLNNSDFHELVATSEGCADRRNVVRAERCFPAHDGSTAPREECTDSVYDLNNVVAKDVMSESGIEVHLLVSAETSTVLKNPPSTVNTTVHPEKITEKPYDFEGIVAVVHQTAPDHVPDGTQVPLQNTTRDDNCESKLCVPGGVFNEEQATGSPTNVVTKDASAPLRGRGKLLNHRNCVAIKKAIDAGLFKKRRREKDQVDITRKRLFEIDTNPGVDLSICQVDGFAEEPLSSSVPLTPTNSEKKNSVFGSIVNPELGIDEEENKMHVINDSILEPLWVLALPRIWNGKFPAVIHSTPSTTSSDREQQSALDPIEKRDLEDYLDALESLIARVHVLGIQLQSDKVQKRKKIVWKISDGSVFFSSEGEGAIFDEEANNLDVTSHIGDNSELNYVPKWYLLSVLASVAEKNPDGEVDALNASSCLDPEYMQERLPCVYAEATNLLQKNEEPSSFKALLDYSVCGRKSQSRRKATKRGATRMRSLRNLGTFKSQKLSQPEPTNQSLLVRSGNVTSKVNGRLKRKQVDDKGFGKDSKKMRAGVSTALVKAVGNSPAGVELPHMRGSLQFSKRKPVRMKTSKTSQKLTSQEKYMDSIGGRKEQLVESVGCHQEQQAKGPLCKHIEQKSIKESSLSGFPTKFHLSSGSILGISSPGNLGFKTLEGESQLKDYNQSREISVLDNEYEENKIKLQPNGNWCIKVFTVHGKIEWIGNYATTENALSAYDVVNPSSSSKEKEVPPPSHTSPSCLRVVRSQKAAKVTPPSLVQLVEPNVGSAVFVAKAVNETSVGVFSLNETSGADKKENEGQDAGAAENIIKLVETYEQGLSVISTKKDASMGLGVVTSSLFTKEGVIQERLNTVRGATTHSLSEGPLDSQVVNADKDIQHSGIVQDKPSVKVVVAELQPIAAAGSAHDSWIHDTAKCRYGKDALDRLSMDNFETIEEIEVARQVKMALWRGLCCVPQSCGLGLDLFKRVQLLLQPRMHFERLTDGDSHKILLSTGKPGEEIYLGHYVTETEFDTARRVISRCKKELQKFLVMFEGSHNPQVASDGAQTKIPPASISLGVSVGKASSSSLVEATEQCTGPTSTIQVTGELGMQGLIINREFGQLSTRTENTPKPSTAAGDSRAVPTLEQINSCQTSVSSRAAAGPQNVIVLDDDDDNKGHVAPVSSLPTSARAFSGLTHDGNNASAQREYTVQSNRSSRANGLLNDVVSAYPGDMQEQRYHLTGGSSAVGQIGASQTVPGYLQIVNTDIDPVQRVGQASGTLDAQLHGRTHAQPVRQEGLGSEQTVATPFLFGNVVDQQQQQLLNQYGGTVLVSFVDSFERRLKIPSSSLQDLQGPVGVSTSHVPVNRPREMGNIISLPTACNTSAAATSRSTLKSKVYSCCSGIVASEQDFMLFKALYCANCNRTVHTDCAIASNRLALRSLSIRSSVQEKAMYVCTCGKPWLVVSNILSRMKEFIMQIWRQQLDKLSRHAQPVTVFELDWGQELNVIMGTLHKIVFKARFDPSLKIKKTVECMHGSVWVDASRVNFLEWLTLIDNALKLTVEHNMRIWAH